MIPICPAESAGAFKMSVERLDDNKGYDVAGNVVLVWHLFQAKLSSTQREDEDGNEEFNNLSWSREMFFRWGKKIFGDEMRCKFTDLPPEQQREHEDRISAAMQEE